jgi:uncharacterized protein YceK
MKSQGWLIVAAFLAATVPLTGCGTFANMLGAKQDGPTAHEQESGKIYGGVRMDCEAFFSYPPETVEQAAIKSLQACLLTVDLPLCVVADTLTLPATISYTLECQAAAKEWNRAGSKRRNISALPGYPHKVIMSCSIHGIARDAKGSATVVEEDGQVTYVLDLPCWPESIRDKKVLVQGELIHKEVALKALHGIVSPDLLANHTWIVNACWRAGE